MSHKVKQLFLLFLIAGVFSCNNNQEDKKMQESESTNTNPDSTSAVSDAAYFWEAKDINGKLEMQKIRKIPADSLNYNAVIGLVNSYYPDIKLVPAGLSNDTLAIKVENSDYLTNRMGSTGAETYIKELIYNLTELKDIHYIDLRFKRGNHADPGIYTRADFVN